MKISTRGRYALRAVVTLAAHGGGYVSLKETAEKNGISLKYLESIMADLSKAGVVETKHGKNGGYRLKKTSSETTCGEILRVTEGGIAPVACLEQSAKVCPNEAVCKTVKMWRKLDRLVSDFLDGVTIDDLLNEG